MSLSGKLSSPFLVDQADDSHRLTGWNAVKSRVEQLNLEMSDEQVKDATAKIKELADVRTQSMEDVDKIYHTAIQSGSLKVGQSEVLDQLLEKVCLFFFQSIMMS
jgi:homocitrate synthase